MRVDTIDALSERLQERQIRSIDVTLRMQYLNIQRRYDAVYAAAYFPMVAPAMPAKIPSQFHYRWKSHHFLLRLFLSLGVTSVALSSSLSSSTGAGVRLCFLDSRPSRCRRLSLNPTLLALSSGASSLIPSFMKSITLSAPS